MATPDSESVSELTKAANELIERVTAINVGSVDQVTALAVDAKRRRRVVNLLAIVAVVELLLAAFVGVALHGVADNTNRLDQTSTINRQKALCPLYSVILASDTPEARDQSADKALYDRTVTVIRDGYVALQCDDFKGKAPTLGSSKE